MIKINIKKRQKDILNILLNTDAPIKSSELSEKFEVSIRTVQNDMGSIKYFLKQIKVTLSSKSNVGFWIENLCENKEKIIEYMNSDISFVEVDERQEYIIAKLLNNSGSTFTTKLFSDELLISNAAAYRTLEFIESWLSKFDLKLFRKKGLGIKIEGSEINIRYAMFSQISENDCKKFNTDSNIKDEAMLKRIENISYYINNIDKNEIHELIKILNNVEDINNDLLIGREYQNLVINLIIILSRIKKGHVIRELEKQNLNELKEFKIASNILIKMKECFGINYNENEIYNLTRIFIGNRHKTDDDTMHQIKHFNSKEYLKISNEVINYIENELNIHLGDDNNFALNLKLHLVSTMKSVKFGIRIMNPLLNEIKMSYPYAFNIALDIIKRINEKYSLKMDENNAGYIALFIQGIMEENEYKKLRSINTYLVCNSGLGLVNLLSIQIKKRFNEINIVKLTSQKKLQKELINSQKSERPELIITAIPIVLNTDIFIVQVNPILSEKDICRIDNAVKKIMLSKQSSEKKGALRKYINKDIVYKNTKFDSRYELFKFISDDLVKKGYVTKEFEESLFKREEMSSTYVSNSVAVPHGSADFVLKPCIALISLDKPIAWDGLKVTTVFLCAFDLSVDNDSEDIFQELYSAIENKKQLKMLISSIK